MINNKEIYDYTATISSNANTKPSRVKTFSSTSNESQLNTKDLIVSLDSNSYQRNFLYPTSTVLSNTSTSKLQDLDRRLDQVILCDKSSHLKLKQNQRMFSCLLVQQYFFYFILLAFILLSSFGFYYVIVTTSLRIETLENMIAQQLDNKIQMRFISSKDYFSDNESSNNRARRNNYLIYSSEIFEQIETVNEDTNDLKIPKYFLLKQINKTDFALFPAYLSQTKSKKSLNQYCLSSRDYCVNLLNKKEPKKKNLNRSSKINASKAKEILLNDTSNLSQSPSYSFYMNSKINQLELNTNIHEMATISLDTVVKTSSSSPLQFTESTTTQMDKFKFRNNRHRTDIDAVSTTTTPTFETQKISESSIRYSLMMSSEKTCDLNVIESEPNYIVFMGVFHCTWMNNIGSKRNHKESYYLTKSYKGSLVSLCSNLDELRSNRCYKTIPLKYPYYGTGHTIYKDYMFYAQDSSSHLVSHSIKSLKSSEENDSDEIRQIDVPDDAVCCDSSASLYSVKHSGHFDFEIDENGLWLIYKQKMNLKEKKYFTSQDDEYDVYIIAKINDKEYRNLKIDQKWQLKIRQNSIANMFITCGKLYGLKSTYNSPAVIYKLCDLLNDYDCSKSSAMNDMDAYNITISSRQLTSLSYNKDRKLLYMVDGGSFVSYNLQTVKI